MCGAQFETRRGLSSHARSHLRQLGVGVSESSGAPIDLLYQIAKERHADGQISPTEPPSAKTSSAPQKDEEVGDMDFDEDPIPFSILGKAAKALPPSSSAAPSPSPGASPGPPHSGSQPAVVRKAPISSLLPVSSPLRSPDHKPGGTKGLTSNLSSKVTTKPLWAPQENDAPLNLSKCLLWHPERFQSLLSYSLVPPPVQPWRWTPTRTSSVSCAAPGSRPGRVYPATRGPTCGTSGWSTPNPRALPSTC